MWQRATSLSCMYRHSETWSLNTPRAPSKYVVPCVHSKRVTSLSIWARGRDLIRVCRPQAARCSRPAEISASIGGARTRAARARFILKLTRNKDAEPSHGSSFPHCLPSALSPQRTVSPARGTPRPPCAGPRSRARRGCQEFYARACAPPSPAGAQQA